MAANGSGRSGSASASFGKRRPPPTPAPSATKRSRVVSLALLAGAGLTAYGVARLDPSQREEDVRVYPDDAACTAARLRSPQDCADAYAAARALYPTSAPRYPDQAACEAHHGSGHCEPGAGAAAGTYVPRMAGYLVGTSAEQGLAPQPVFEHAPQDEAAAGHGGGYCTGSGARITTVGAGRSNVARVSSAALRGTHFGGFGETGRSFSAHGSAAS